MSENVISVKVLIDKQVYEKLKSDSQKYIEHCTKKISHLNLDKEKEEKVDSDQSGGGSCDQVMVPVFPEQTEQRNAVIPKCSKIDGPTVVDVPEDKKEDIGRLSDQNILDFIWTRFKPKARKLLAEFKKHPLNINWTLTGEVILNGELYPETKISQLLAVCFYPLKAQKLYCLSIFIEILKDLNLIIYVKNWEIKKTTFNDGWFRDNFM